MNHEFQDDGGTPAYRARTVEHRAPLPPRLTLVQRAYLAAFFGFAVPVGIIVFGLVGLVAWDRVAALFDRH